MRTITKDRMLGWKEVARENLYEPVLTLIITLIIYANDMSNRMISYASFSSDNSMIMGTANGEVGCRMLKT